MRPQIQIQKCSSGLLIQQLNRDMYKILVQLIISAEPISHMTRHELILDRHNGV